MPLYLVATPIGNLADITQRAISTLTACDYVLCEDTRHSGKLFNYLEIEKPLRSYHKFNETSRGAEVLDDLRAGKDIALICDAGTPGISDPGQVLVQMCVAAEIPVLTVPGPCAAVAALTISGMPTERFQFVGFLPKKQSELSEVLTKALIYDGTTVCYESPKRLAATVHLLAEIHPDAEVAVARELTKRFEEVLHGTAQALAERLQQTEVKGEVVLVIGGGMESAQEQWWAPMSVTEHVTWIEKFHDMRRNDAIKAVAKERAIPRSDVYDAVHKS